eukprot:GDKJ01025997.1.p1 GENE.GDKJ01025997.1~~GDKJ01025997.1.p1  ORF type:complete len:338 (+),score=70.21 GDKJ01025997.1:39-1052(+)
MDFHSNLIDVNMRYGDRTLSRPHYIQNIQNSTWRNFLNSPSRETKLLTSKTTSSKIDNKLDFLSSIRQEINNEIFSFQNETPSTPSTHFTAQKSLKSFEYKTQTIYAQILSAMPSTLSSPINCFSNTCQYSPHQPPSDACHYRERHHVQVSSTRILPVCASPITIAYEPQASCEPSAIRFHVSPSARPPEFRDLPVLSFDMGCQTDLQGDETQQEASVSKAGVRKKSVNEEEARRISFDLSKNRESSFPKNEKKVDLKQVSDQEEEEDEKKTPPVKKPPRWAGWKGSVDKSDTFASKSWASKETSAEVFSSTAMAEVGPVEVVAEKKRNIWAKYEKK